MWLNRLKAAIIQKDIELLEKLIDEMPEFKKEKEIRSVGYLLKEAANFVEELKDETAVKMEQIKKNIDFLNSTKNPKPNKLDISS
jgi:phage-related protein